MKRIGRKFNQAFTLVEMMTVVAIAVLLMAVALPSVPGMVRSSKMSNAKNLIKTALTQAQSYAIRNGKNAGIRFQKAANGKTYLVLVENQRSYDWCDMSLSIGSRVKLKGNFSNRYVAIPNAQPKALPDGVAVISFSQFFEALSDVDKNNYLQDFASCNDTIIAGGGSLENYQTFTIIFSASGQMVSRYVQVQPRRNQYGELVDRNNGYWVDSVFGPYQLTIDSPSEALLSYDNFTDYYDYSVIFNSGISPYNVNNRAIYLAGIANRPAEWNMFSTTDDLYLSESSATSLFVYMEDDLTDIPQTSRWTEYFSMSYPGQQDGCEFLLINRYTGNLIETE